MLYPNGWFAVCLSSSLKPGRLRTVAFMGNELLVYRTRSGRVRVIEPHCPHLGAHFGYGGKVDGENLVCPFHGLVFGPNGVCIGAGRSRTPPRAKLDEWLVQERAGAVLVWRHNKGKAPDWEVPDSNMAGFSAAQEACFELKGYSYYGPENTADATHFMQVHHLTDVAMSHEIRQHQMEVNLTASWFGWQIKVRMINYGVGCAYAESELPAWGLFMKSYSFGTPIAPLKWTYTLLDSTHVRWLDALPRVLRWPPQALVGALMHWLTVKEIRKDFRIWNHRRHVNDPKLMQGEMHIAAFRRWMMQFYLRD
ncbi:Rieske 2Fe-2S domain-containing protein [Dyella nitratireducens]|uniref:cholesterol 7-desaturase n=1 Tax=Dyella nitratireducens TaxID=1849580 RepID=A0ABQ1G209_9GAMM|nr:Rieske 2Fe-2S domain-containing protein [Dyella nitratireducens]GGA35814.1 hypothetical protein GCM10010981_26140 [Dyella nitratireducens]GLQ41049.1 hypothetical protein GCM10007902_08990 [Dyella nitratireducens]